jgi:hypothetical protein
VQLLVEQQDRRRQSTQDVVRIRTAARSPQRGRRDGLAACRGGDAFV